MPTKRTCSKCKGTGAHWAGRCYSCNGTGEIIVRTAAEKAAEAAAKEAAYEAFMASDDPYIVNQRRIEQRTAERAARRATQSEGIGS